MEDITSLVESHIQLARILAIQYAKSRRMPIDDAISAAFYALTESATRFDPRRGLKFSTLAVQRISGALLDESRRYFRTQGFIRRGQVVQFVPEELAGAIADSRCSPHEEFDSRERWFLLLSVCRNPREEVIIEALAQGWTTTEISEQLEITASRVSQIKTRIIKRLPEHIEWN